jgi:hypothetical protein
MDDMNASNERVIRELSKIRAIKVGDKKRLLNPLTKTQKDIRGVASGVKRNSSLLY